MQFGIKQTSSFSSGFLHHHPSSHPGFAPQGQGLPKMSGFDSALNNKSNFSDNPKKCLNEWQNGLRALLPSVNINFAMDGTNSTSSPLNNPTRSLHQNNSSQVFRGPSPPNHSFSHGPSIFSKGFEELPPTALHNNSSFFPSNYDHNPAYFQNGLGLGSNISDRYNSVAPPPGLGTFHNDPAIISSGNKTPVKQTPTTEEAPHWMRSLQALVETDGPVNPPHSLPVATQTHANLPLTSWPTLPNSGVNQLGSIPQPPPGFQGRLSYTNTMDFSPRQGLLES